jgi:hypothetical protein
MVYDSANRHLFIANRARDHVEILSTLDASGVGSADAAGASSVDISADGKIIWVGTFTNRSPRSMSATYSAPILFN